VIFDCRVTTVPEVFKLLDRNWGAERQMNRKSAIFADTEGMSLGPAICGTPARTFDGNGNAVFTTRTELCTISGTIAAETFDVFQVTRGRFLTPDTDPAPDSRGAADFFAAYGSSTHLREPTGESAGCRTGKLTVSCVSTFAARGACG
jgi:hypothetical protein